MMLNERGILNSDSLMMLFTEMYLSDTISDDNFASVSKCVFSNSYDVCNLYVATRSLVFHKFK